MYCPHCGEKVVNHELSKCEFCGGLFVWEGEYYYCHQCGRRLEKGYKPFNICPVCDYIWINQPY